MFCFVNFSPIASGGKNSRNQVQHHAKSSTENFVATGKTTQVLSFLNNTTQFPDPVRSRSTSDQHFSSSCPIINKV